MALSHIFRLKFKISIRLIAYDLFEMHKKIKNLSTHAKDKKSNICSLRKSFSIAVMNLRKLRRKPYELNFHNKGFMVEKEIS